MEINPSTRGWLFGDERASLSEVFVDNDEIAVLYTYFMAFRPNRYLRVASIREATSACECE